MSSINDYMPYMEKIDSDIMDKVLKLTEVYDYNKYTERDVLEALSKDYIDFNDYGALLSPVAFKYIEKMAQKAKAETFKHFGNSVCLFTPLYIANYCENQCIYCGFNCSNQIKRGALTYEEIETEVQNIAKTGLKEILLLTGEAPTITGVEYIGEAVKICKKYFTNIGIEVYPMNSDEYAYLQKCGADFVSVYQETYNLKEYDKNHPKGPKRCFPYRFNAQERALLGGMRGVAFGCLLGLSNDFRKDAYAAGCHAYLIGQKYPQGEISFSVPRIRPFINNEKNGPKDVFERELLQVMLSYRLLMPYAGITISTREAPKFRNNIVGLCATKISAGVRVSVGGHDEEAKGDEQFEISDPRSVKEVTEMLKNKGLQPVFTDYIYV